MRLKKTKYTMVIIVTAAATLLLNMVMNLSDQKKEDRASIQVLTREIALMEKKLSELEKYKDNMELHRFQEHIFKLRYPRFTDIAQIVFKKSNEYAFNPYLVMAVIQVESNFDPSAVSKAGAYGLMQVNYTVWREELNIDFNRIFDEEYNIDLGLKILKQYYEETNGNLMQALFHYNNGYKFNNTAYSGKVVSTNFYANKDKAAVKKEEENLSI